MLGVLAVGDPINLRLYGPGVGDDREPTRIQTRKIGKRNTTESCHNVSHTEKIATILFLIHILI
jgi:hypothetical protein